MTIQRIFLGSSHIFVKDPGTRLILTQKANPDSEITQKLMNVTFRYVWPEVEFQVLDMPTIHIFDHRDSVAKIVRDAFSKSSFETLTKALNRPAVIEVVKDNGHIYIFVASPKRILKKNTHHKLEINIEQENLIPTHKFLFFERGPQADGTLSFVTLYKS